MRAGRFKVTVMVPHKFLHDLYNTQSLSAVVQCGQDVSMEEQIDLSTPTAYTLGVWHGSKIIEVASDRYPLELKVLVRSHSDRDGSRNVLIYVKEKIIWGPMVSTYTVFNRNVD